MSSKRLELKKKTNRKKKRKYKKEKSEEDVIVCMPTPTIEEDESMVKEVGYDPDAMFAVTFIEGHFFKNIVNFCSSMQADAFTPIFSNDGITFTIESDTGSMLLYAVICKSDLTDYEFSSTEEDLILSLDFDRFKGLAKTTKKKGSIYFYQIPDESDKGTSYIYSGMGDRLSKKFVSYMLPSKVNQIPIYHLPVYTCEDNKPNCTITLDDFSSACTSITSDSVTLRGYPRGIKIFADDAGSTSGFYWGGGYFSDCKRKTLEIDGDLEYLDEMIEHLIVPMSTIKILSKINTLSTGNVKFFFETGKPIRLLLGLGSFGVVNIYLTRSSSE